MSDDIYGDAYEAFIDEIYKNGGGEPSAVRAAVDCALKSLCADLHAHDKRISDLTAWLEAADKTREDLAKRIVRLTAERDAERNRANSLHKVVEKAVEYLVQMELEGETTSAVPLRMALALATDGLKETERRIDEELVEKVARVLEGMDENRTPWRDAARTLITTISYAMIEKVEYLEEELDAAEMRISDETRNADATIIRLRGLLQEAVDEEVWPDDLAARIRTELEGVEK